MEDSPIILQMEGNKKEYKRQWYKLLGLIVFKFGEEENFSLLLHCKLGSFSVRYGFKGRFISKLAISQ